MRAAIDVQDVTSDRRSVGQVHDRIRDVLYVEGRAIGDRLSMSSFGVSPEPYGPRNATPMFDSEPRSCKRHDRDFCILDERARGEMGHTLEWRRLVWDRRGLTSDEVFHAVLPRYFHPQLGGRLALAVPSPCAHRSEETRRVFGRSPARCYHSSVGQTNHIG
jgi:hypothetical protein